MDIELVVTAEARRWVLPCQAVLFDMDGTLVDSSLCVESTWRLWAARHGIDAEALLIAAHGRQNPDTIRAVAPHLDLEQECAFMVAAEEACRDGIVPIPGARELVAQMPAGRWAVVTSAWRRLVEIRMECAGLPAPPVLLSADEVARGKPHPDGYLMAAAGLGVAPAKCVVIEDAPAGVAAGRAAGMPVIALSTSMSADALGAEICVPDLRAITVNLRSGGGGAGGGGGWCARGPR